jgi:low affinity Fe/Cu permease
MRAGDVVQSAVPPAKTPASSIHSLWQLMFLTAVTVFTLAFAFLIAALVRALQRKHDGHVGSLLTVSPRARFHRVVRSARL